MKYFLKSKKEVNQEAEPYDDKEHLTVRLWGTHLPDYVIIIADRITQPNLICDLKEHGEQLWLSAFDDETLRTVYDALVPADVTKDVSSFLDFLTELEKK
jgi:hypothetical protein